MTETCETKTLPRVGLRLMLTVLTLGGLTLTACGDNGETASSGGPEAGSHEDVALTDTNPVDREDLQDGGELTLSVESIGGNWNVAATDGYFGSTLDVLAPMYNLSAYISDAEGNLELNTDYFLDIQEEFDEDGTQILHYTLNPDAVWNDGTPIDFYTYEHTVEVKSSLDEGYDSLAADLFNRVDYLEMGDNEFEFTMYMAETQFPHRAFWSSYAMVHPDVDTVEEFNEGFIDDVKPEYRMGPFILDIYDRAANVVTMVPNPNWWGEEPVLDRITFIQQETGATIQSFQNGEVDNVQLQSADRYQEILSWRDEGDGYELRSGLLARTEGYFFNGEARNISDIEVRRAIFTAIDRQMLSEVRLQGLNWEEEIPGSWNLMTSHELYQDNYPIEEENRANPELASEILDEAGWTLDEGADVRTNGDGEPLVVTLDTFGSDSTETAVNQSFQTMMAEIGIEIDIRPRVAGEYSSAINEGDVNMWMGGYGTGTDAWGGPPTFYVDGPSNNTNLGDPELTQRIEELTDIPDDEERAREAMDIERDAIATYYHYLPLYNGPEIWAVTEGLANHGPRLFESIDWTLIGWEEGTDEHEDTGVDIDELDGDS